METSQNLAAQIVNSACQEFQQLAAQQATLVSMAQKAGMQAKAYKIITLFILALFLITMFASLFVKQGYNMIIIAVSAVGIAAIVFFVLYLCYAGKERACYRDIKTIAAGRLKYVKAIINQTLMAHIQALMAQTCANDGDETIVVSLERIKKIINGFFTDDFNSSLTAEEASEIRNWLRTSYSACIRAD